MIKDEITFTRRKGKLPITGLFITHVHFGHCSGLWELGKECISEQNLPIYCTSEIKSFFENNHPFNHLIAESNILVKDFRIGEELSYENFVISSFEVPHRNEFANTVGYKIVGKKSIIYLPDLDFWTDEIIEKISKVDIAFIDGTFYLENELPRRSKVPHPTIIKSMDLLKEVNTDIYFTHFNHTNKILNEKNKERKEIEKKGFKIAFDGLLVEI